MGLSNKKIVIVIHDKQYVQHEEEQEVGETVVGKKLTLKNLGISRYLEIKYLFKDIKELTFEANISETSVCDKDK